MVHIPIFWYTRAMLNSTKGSSLHIFITCRYMLAASARSDSDAASKAASERDFFRSRSVKDRALQEITGWSAYSFVEHRIVSVRKATGIATKYFLLCLILCMITFFADFSMCVCTRTHFCILIVVVKGFILLLVSVRSSCFVIIGSCLRFCLVIVFVDGFQETVEVLCG